MARSAIFFRTMIKIYRPVSCCRSVCSYGEDCCSSEEDCWPSHRKCHVSGTLLAVLEESTSLLRRFQPNGAICRMRTCELSLCSVSNAKAKMSWFTSLVAERNIKPDLMNYTHFLDPQDMCVNLSPRSQTRVMQAVEYHWGDNGVWNEMQIIVRYFVSIGMHLSSNLNDLVKTWIFQSTSDLFEPIDIW